jgi:SAM-dependent methyltransferase
MASLFVCLSAQGEQINKDYLPRSGQEGKDVIWVPTPQILVEKMLDMADVTSDDFVIDLGSGDGRLVIAAAKRGARARGIEYNQDMVELSGRNAENEGVSDRVEFIREDLFESDLSQATVITMFLLTSINVKLRPKLLELKPGTRIVSNTFTMEEWIADESVSLFDDCDFWCDALLWIIPAKVEGRWKIPQGELRLNQNFQMVSGTLTTGLNTITISDGRLYGDQITFRVNDEKYSGNVKGNTIEGIVTSTRNSIKWNAVRKGH